MPNIIEEAVDKAIALRKQREKEQEAREYEKAVRKYQAKCDAEMFCRCHELSEKLIKEVSDGYVFQIKFPF